MEVWDWLCSAYTITTWNQRKMSIAYWNVTTFTLHASDHSQSLCPKLSCYTDKVNRDGTDVLLSSLEVLKVMCTHPFRLGKLGNRRPTNFYGTVVSMHPSYHLTSFMGKGGTQIQLMEFEKCLYWERKTKITSGCGPLEHFSVLVMWLLQLNFNLILMFVYLYFPIL